MSIVAYEIHFETKKSIGDIMEYFKSKGVATDFKMCKDTHHGMLQIKHPQKAEIYNFKIKLYEELGDTKHYELMSGTKEQFALSEKWFKEV